MSFQWYQARVLEHLSDSTRYKETSEPKPESFYKPLEMMCETHNLPKFRIVPDNKGPMKPAIVCIMPKIHKTPTGIRPIIPSVAWYTTKAAKYLHETLLPLIEY